MDRIIVGIDGGGTHTTLAVSNKEGCLLGLVQGEALNFNTIGMDTFRTHLRRALDEVERRYGPIEALSLGHSALDDEPSPQLAAEIMGDVFDVSRCYIHSDVFMALMGATLGEPGVAVVAGTGAMAVGMDDQGVQHVRGGWGYLLGDAGSGFFLGRQAMEAAAAAFDGVGPHTWLETAFLQHFRCTDPRAAIGQIYAPDYKPADMAAFAPKVLEGADQGDTVCNTIINESLNTLVGYAAGLMKDIGRAECTVGVFGGLFERSVRYREGFARRLERIYPQAKVGIPQLAPYVGAVVYYFLKKKELTQQVVANLRATAKGLQERK